MAKTAHTLAHRNDDAIWFKQRAKRNFRIRPPAASEFRDAFLLMGETQPQRRKVIVWRVPRENPLRHMVPDGLMRIPFLAFADETIEDSDVVLEAVFAGIMRDASKQTEGGAGPLIETGASEFRGWDG